jgi:CRP-like cAMP-binding protein
MHNVTLYEISNLSIFNNLHIDTIEKLKNKSIKQALCKGALLFYEKDVINYVYFVLKGNVSLFKTQMDGHKKIFFILSEGEVINEVIIDNLPASVCCEAIEDSIVLEINKTDLLSIMKDDFQLTENIMLQMSKKTRRLYRQLKNTVPIKVDKRVAAKLWKLSKDYGKEIDGGTIINLNISITYLSDMLGSARETVSRALKTLEKKGLIRFEGKKILVIDRAALAKYFKQN